MKEFPDLDRRSTPAAAVASSVFVPDKPQPNRLRQPGTSTVEIGNVFREGS